jgi:two-component system, response regulator PdtaR
MHALIIEDEPLIAFLIEGHLRAWGYASIEIASTEADAVEAARRCSPDLITSDVRLADGCGIAAVMAIRGGADARVVFITASIDEVRNRIAEAVVVSKPFTQAELRAAVCESRPGQLEPAPPSGHGSSAPDG